MSRLHERVNMTYYEELGLESTASPEEIRHAYKRLARLVHPDQCGDENTRKLADLQMKRLNEMAGILLDSGRRDQYDRSLMALAIALEAPVSRRRFRDARWARPAAICGTAALMVLLRLHVPSRPQMPPIPQAAMAAAIRPATPPVPRHPVRMPRLQTPEELGDFEPLANYAAESAIAIPPLPFPEQAGGPAPPTDPPRATLQDGPATERVAGLAGDWLFQSSSAAHSRGYPPEFIELRIRQEGGLLRGHYRARYRVNDRAVSPNVEFQFEGRSGPDGGSFPWRGPGRAQGQVRLNLLPEGGLEVKWEADQMGSELGLISGTATLVRKQE